jgi:Flp pilus assembly protein TadB
VKSPEDKYENLERIERQIREKETELRLRHLEDRVNADNAKVYPTVKHQPEKSEKLWQKKAILGAKLFALGVMAIVAVKVASFLAGIVIIGLLGFVAYKLFFDQNKKKG